MKRCSSAIFANQIEPFQQELSQAQAELRAFLEAHPEPVRGERPTDEGLALDQLRGRVSQAINRIENARNQIDEAQLAQSISESAVYENYRVVDAPELPFKPTLGLRGVVTNIVIFVAVGVILMILGIAGGAVLDRSVRFALDIRIGLDLPILAMLPDIRLSSSRKRFRWGASPFMAKPTRGLVATDSSIPEKSLEPVPTFDTALDLDHLLQELNTPTTVKDRESPITDEESHGDDYPFAVVGTNTEVCQ
ncbi:MAG: hypothetical protein HC822_20045 [Oscillochloris sp.]|nr:hypothetical protein [Oscillochloris sp.]